MAVGMKYWSTTADWQARNTFARTGDFCGQANSPVQNISGLVKPNLGTCVEYLSNKCSPEYICMQPRWLPTPRFFDKSDSPCICKHDARANPSSFRYVCSLWRANSDPNLDYQARNSFHSDWRCFYNNIFLCSYFDGFRSCRNLLARWKNWRGFYKDYSLTTLFCLSAVLITWCTPFF